MTQDPYRPERRWVRESFQRAAAQYDAAAVLQREVGGRLQERLEFVRLAPERVLDLGAGSGRTTRALMDRYRKARFVALDLAPAMLRQARRRAPWLRRLPGVCADAANLPLAADSFDLVFSNLTLQWLDDLDAVFREVQRVLRPGGLFLFSSFGPDTLRELRQAWSAADGHTHVNAFIDLHDIGDALVRAQLADPVMEMEELRMTYSDVRALMRDLKTIGAHNVTAGRPRGLTGRGRLRAMTAAYEAHRDAEGRLPATYEVVYGHAWGTEAQPQRRTGQGEVAIPLHALGRRRPT